MDMHGNLNTSLLRTLLIAGLGLTVVGPAQASPIPWSNSSGSNAAFGWSNGENNTGRFGNPTVTTAGFLFNQMDAFIAQGGGGGGASTTDFARMIVNVANSTPPGAPAVHQIIVQEWGTWSASAGSVPADFAVQADFAVFRYLPTPLGTTGSLSLPVTFNSNGTWTASRTLTAGAPNNPPFANLDWRKFQMTVTNTIQVNGSAPAGSFIEKTNMWIIIPEPASLLLVLGGLLPLVRRRHG